MKALLITFYYPPEAGAPQSRLSAQTTAMLRRGHAVDVLTTMPNYPVGRPFQEYAGRMFQAEDRAGSRVYRTWSLSISNLAPQRRLLKYLTFVATGILVLVALRIRGRRYDCVLVESPPLFTCLLGVFAKALWKAAFVTQVSDLWVDLLPEFGILPADSNTFRAVLWLEWRLLAASTHIVTVTRGCQKALSAKVQGRIPVSLVTNGADLSVYSSSKADRGSFREWHRWAGRTVCVYAGNLGYIHGLEALGAAAEALRADEHIHFVVLGDGVFKPRLAEFVSARQLANVEIMSSIPETLLSELLHAADIGLVFLDGSERARDAISVKTFSYMASGLPIAGCCAGTTREIVERSGCGILVPPGHGVELAETLRMLAADPALRSEMGARGREAVRPYDRAALGRAFSEIVERAEQGENSMNSPDLRIVALTHEHVRSLVDAYRVVFPASFSTSLGPMFLRCSMRRMINAPNNCSRVLIDETGKVVGFALGTMASAPRLSRSAKLEMGLALFARVLVNPRVLRSLWIRRRRLADRLLADPDGTSLHLASFGLRPAIRGNGWAGRLLLSFEEAALAMGAARGVLGVEKDNVEAVRFYEKHGWTIEEESVSAYGRLSLRMAKLLDATLCHAGHARN